MVADKFDSTLAFFFFFNRTMREKYAQMKATENTTSPMTTAQ